jgi:hypothetical protein
LLRQVASSHWFALLDLFLVVLSSLLWIFRPEIGILPILTIALIPWGVRIFAGVAPVKSTPFHWLVLVFLITAWAGYWAGYDQAAAWSKVWFVALAVLLFFALSSQPVVNLEWVCVLLFCIGVGVAIYFLLTHDFVALPRKVELLNRIGRRMMEAIPRPGWTSIHPNYVAGIAAITTPFILYPAGKLVKRGSLFSALVSLLIFLGFGLALFAILLATSRGATMAIGSAVGIWLVWRIAGLNGSSPWLRREAVFPSLVLLCLGAVVLFLYAGPARSGYAISDHYAYGSGSRSELLARSFYLLLDFPFTGGGLASFPGLYSYYMLGIPNFNVPNSHNLFLDVAIEQGMLGGLAYFMLVLMSIWLTARSVTAANSQQARVYGWLTLSALVMAFVHGMVDNYLYHASGTVLSLSLVGLPRIAEPGQLDPARPGKHLLPGFAALILICIFMLNLNRIRSAWEANLGAVQMAKAELAGFPTNQWADPSILPQLEQADAALRTALLSDPANRTANHRLGLIALLRRDFPSAAAFLEEAYRSAPNHRGVIKALGYCYAWLGEMEKARSFLSKIPEARTELDVYTWWWRAQGQPGLAERASTILSELNR